ncbi:M23 family metallopeptidase [Rhodohalobacter sp. 614A]|uniref:M23 family metallopeptidase n=1 Tax=Rhodohalobacter sp. 614A TaxID=2908649 RepID=UPI001F1E5A82|nr:M23 family metallopeptidase [Rhodohalobacter sp. 614A]
MFARNLKILVLVLGLLMLANSQIMSQPLPFLEDSVTYAWPTDATHQISSTFGETRSAHLHAGLDIRTWGQEGYNVFATRDGIVYRIATGPHGYGNVVYLKHKDGSYSVYAHLNRFEPELQAFVDSIRMTDYSSAIDEIVEADSITYKKGEVIAFSGSTGIGPPHLHFELRTPDHEPFNPLLTNIRVTDNIPPVFRQLGIEFLDSGSLKPDGFEIINARRNGNLYDFGSVTVNQPIGLAVNVHDRANQTPNVYAVHTLTLVYEADTLYHSSVDQFSYEETGQMFLDRSYLMLAQTRRGFQRLYRVAGNKLPIYKILKNEGVLTFEDGTYPLRIIASDIYGNRTTAAVTIRVNNYEGPEKITHVPTYPVPSQTQKPFAISWNKILLNDETPLLANAEDIDFEIQKNETPIRFSSTSSIEKKLTPGVKQIFHTPDQRLWVEFPKDALYDTLDLHLDILQMDDEIQFNFSPDRLPIDGQIYFNYILPEDLKENPHLGLFSADKFRNRLYFMGAVNSDGYIRSSMREISSLVIMEDDTPPWVGMPEFGKNLAGNWIVKIPAIDRQTGIDYRSSIITVNGQRGIVEYDPDINSLSYYLPGFTPSKENNIEAEVFDGMGNRSSRTASLSF